VPRGLDSTGRTAVLWRTASRGGDTRRMRSELRFRRAALLLVPASCLFVPATGTPLDALTFHVDRFDDPDPVAMLCTLAEPNDCSLRGAIVLANQTPVQDLIEVPPGSYALTLEGAPGDDDLEGDLDLKTNIYLRGGGALSTLISAAGVDDRVLEVQPAGANSTLEGVTLAFGSAANGGGILCSSGVVTLRDVWLTGNEATSDGGGLAAFNLCWVQAYGLGLFLNDAGNEGGGAFVGGDFATLSVSRGRVVGNQAAVLGGGIASRGGYLYLSGLELSGNSAVTGGAIFAAREDTADGFLDVANSTIAGNDATNGAGIRTSQIDAQLRHVTLGEQEGDGRSLWASASAANPSLIFVWNSIFAAPCEIGANTDLDSQGGNLEVTFSTCSLEDPSDQLVDAADADLGPLANNGGGSSTIALGPASAARDAASSSCLARDQRLAPRDGPTCDAGAFEAVPGFLFADDFEAGGVTHWTAAEP
jgi:hypothetical protein